MIHFKSGKHTFYSYLSIICVLTIMVISSGCSSFQASKPLTATGLYFDTVISVTIYEQGTDNLLDSCMALASHYEQLFSATIEGSDIWNINHSNGASITVDAETITLLKTALSYSRLSNGAVDPTIGVLSTLWDFQPDTKGTIPASSDISSALSHVGYEIISITDYEVTLADKNAHLDLGFIAKGYIADRLKDYLISGGISSAIINLGGNVLTIGNKPDGSPFKIGIQKPFAPTATAALTLELEDFSAVSSGNYERYFKKDGVLYHHILSTQTGYPADSDLSGVTIISRNSVDGDALSTLCFIYGYEKSVSFLKNYPDIKAVFIMGDGTIHYTNFE